MKYYHQEFRNNVLSAQNLNQDNIKGISYIVFSKENLYGLFKVHSYKFKKNQFLKEISFEVFKSVKNQYNKFIDIWKQAGDFIGGYYFGKDVE